MVDRGLPAPAKLNLHLHIVGRREDGMHLIDSVMVLIDLADTIYVTLRQDGKLCRTWNHLDVSDDLCLRAATALQKLANVSLGADIAVEKRIPIGAGLGGASSDAATTLLALNALWQAGFTRQQLAALAAQLGADIPFFLFGETARAQGIGECLTAIEAPLHYYLLAFPGKAATAAVFEEYQQITDKQHLSNISEALQHDCNHLAVAAVRVCPPIIAAAQQLQAAAGEARLSGSGACVFAAFDTVAAAKAAQQKLPSQLPSVVSAGIIRHPLLESHLHWGVAKW